jgi:hypothetical protein
MQSRLRGAGLALLRNAERVNSSHPTWGAPPGELRISILHTPDCPSVSRVRQTLEEALESVGATAVIEEIEGACLSPTVLIDGVEIDGYRLGSDPACRIALPEAGEIAAAITAAAGARRTHFRTGGEDPA